MNGLFTLARRPSRRRETREAGSSRELDEALIDRRTRALPAWLEERFQDETAEDQIRALYRAALAAALVYNVQLVAEWSLTRDVFGFAAALHYGLVTPALLLIAAFARSAATPLRRDLMGVAIPMLVALQVAVTYFVSASPGAPYYVTQFAVIAILCNASLPVSPRACLWTTALCLTLLAIAARAPHSEPSGVYVGGLIPVSLCVLMTLHAAFQRNRQARRAYLLDLRQRLRMAEVGQEARHDPLTGLANRRRLEETASKLWANESAHVSPISVVLYDVDLFKAFNDLYGHQAGDDCLRRIAACALTEIGAEDDVAGRYGGEEFILLLPRTPLDEARRAAERLRTAVAGLRIPHAGCEAFGIVTASFGVASADSTQRSFADLTAEADAALYRAKRSGRNRVLVAALESPKGPKAA
ncbi:MAG TPA: diguanylate cyclase [Roseiarcus sp.]|nr:diguanylate cyclase [Roseiarcus sp.]